MRLLFVEDEPDLGVLLCNALTRAGFTVDLVVAIADAEDYLRLATYEFLHQPETPGKVIINEALELARTFSGDEAVRFINGILDAIRKKLERE